MSATIRLNDRQALVFEPVANQPKSDVKRILLTIEGRQPGEAMNCCLIPVDLVPVIIESLRLAASQVQP